ncbi:MAG: glycosyltransferase family 2 protein [Desulfurococcaceae archaeon]
MANLLEKEAMLLDLSLVLGGLGALYTALLIAGLTAYVVYSPRRSKRRANNVEIVMVSKANEKVRSSLLEAARYHAKRFGKLTVVIDEGAPLEGELRRIPGVEVIVVPQGYGTELVGKARALSYFVDNYAERDKWYVFIDDDNFILDDSFLYEIPYYEERGYAAANGVLVPRPGRNKLSYVMDWVRFFDDITIYRFFTGLLGKPLLGLHGELLIVRGDVLKELGFKFRSITEDFRFASELVKRGYKTWQSSTRVSIRSPNSLGDLIKQRGRWFRGVMDDVKQSPMAMKLVVILRSVIVGFAMFSSWLIMPLLLATGIIWILIPTGIYYMTAYSYGASKLGEPLFVFAIPVFGLVEVTSRLYGIFAVSPHEFVVIDKN